MAREVSGVWARSGLVLPFSVLEEEDYNAKNFSKHNLAMSVFSATIISLFSFYSIRLAHQPVHSFVAKTPKFNCSMKETFLWLASPPTLIRLGN